MDYNIDWTDRAREHIAKHSIRPEEVELVVWSSHYVRRARGRAILIGSTGARLLFVLLEPSIREPDAFKVVTARDATRSEKHLWLRRRKG